MQGIYATVIVCCLTAQLPAQIVLQSKYAEGSQRTTEVESSTHQILTIAGMDVETKSTTFITSTTMIGKRKPDGTLEIADRVSRLQLDSTYPGGVQLTFDSDNPDKKSDTPQLEPILNLFRAISKNTTTRVLDKANRFQSIRNSPGITDGLDELVKDQLSEKNMTQTAIQEQNVYPTTPLKKGDSWERTEVTHLGAGQTLTRELVYRYAGTLNKDGRTLERITRSIKSVRLDQHTDSPTPVKLTKSKLKPTPESASELLFDRQRGFTVESRDKMQIKGDLTLTINGMELPGKLDLTISIKTSVRPKSK